MMRMAMIREVRLFVCLSCDCMLVANLLEGLDIMSGELIVNSRYLSFQMYLTSLSNTNNNSRGRHYAVTG